MGRDQDGVMEVKWGRGQDAVVRVKWGRVRTG